MNLEFLLAWLPLSLLQDDLVLFIVRSTLLLLFSFTAAKLGSKASGRVHHLLWSMTFLGLLMMVPLSMFLPRWNLEVLPAKANVASSELSETQNIRTLPGAAPHSSELAQSSTKHQVPPTETPSSPAYDHGRSAASIPMPILVWSMGAFLVMASIVASLLASRSLARGCKLVNDPDWLHLTAEIRSQLGIHRDIPLHMTPEAISPMTGGWLRPKVLLPESARAWSDEKRRIVLQHELVHVARHDVLRHLGVRLAMALYWFHPLAWLAARKAAVARERACDEGVLALGARASAYATHLMELADDLSRAPTPVLALPIIERTPLEERLMAILKDRPGSRNLFASLSMATALLLTLLSVASAQPIPVEPVPAPATPTQAVPEAPKAPTAPEAPEIAPVDALAPIPPPPRAVPALAAPPSPPVPPTPVLASIAPRASESYVPRVSDGACWERDGLRGNFRGTMTSDDHGGYSQFIGFHNGDLAIQQDMLGAQICMRAHGDVELAEDRGRILGIGPEAWIVLEARSGNNRQELRIVEGMKHTWKVNGTERAFDTEAEAWRDQMLVVIGGKFRATWIRSQESSLLGEISSLHGEHSSLRGDIEELDAERRAGEIERELEPEMKTLKRVIDRIG